MSKLLIFVVHASNTESNFYHRRIRVVTHVYEMVFFLISKLELVIKKYHSAKISFSWLHHTLVDFHTHFWKGRELVHQSVSSVIKQILLPFSTMFLNAWHGQIIYGVVVTVLIQSVATYDKSKFCVFIHIAIPAADSEVCLCSTFFAIFAEL